MKFISPQSWFSIELPDGWHEFEDAADSFLFYHPERWQGNFRISASSDRSADYVAQALKEELKAVPDSRLVKIGEWECVFSSKAFQEAGTEYITYYWLTGKDKMLIDASYTITADKDATIGEDVVRSLRLRHLPQEEWHEWIEVRLAEIFTINEGYEWAVKEVKKRLSKPFSSSVEDIARLQQLIDHPQFKWNNMEATSAIGIALGAIMVEEMDGLQWMTVIDGKAEYPALRFADSDITFSPMTFLAEERKAGKTVSLQTAFEKLKARIDAYLTQS